MTLGVKLNILFCAILCCFVLVIACFFLYKDSAPFTEQNIKKIARLGESKWKELLFRYEKEKRLLKIASSYEMVKNISLYKGKIIVVGKSQFDTNVEFTKDNDNAKYYLFDNEGSFYLKVLNIEKIMDDETRYRNLINLKRSLEYEFLCGVLDISEANGLAVELELLAVRVPGMFCIVVDKSDVQFVGYELLFREYEKKRKEYQKEYQKSVLKNLTAIPPGLDPLSKAKLFFYLGKIENNYQLWQKLISKKTSEDWVQAWQRTLTNQKTDFFYLYPDWERTTSTVKSYHFEKCYDNNYTLTLGRVVLEREEGEWKVTTFY